MYSKSELALIRKLNTPQKIQKFLHQIPYNWEKSGETLRGFRGVTTHKTAHCFEAALTAAAILEYHGHHPRLLSLESWDGLDHVLCLFQGPDGRWGTIGKSRLLGMCGRKPVYKSVRSLALSYFDTYVHLTGRLIGYAPFDLGNYPTRVNWRTGQGNCWALNKALVELAHHSVYSSDARYRRLHWRYLYFKVLNPDKPATFYSSKKYWL